MPQPLPDHRLGSGSTRHRDHRVWAVVGDVRRMPEWSPSCAGSPCSAARRSGRHTMLGLNRRGCRLADVLPGTRREPGRAVAWRTRESGATWTYELTHGRGRHPDRPPRPSRVHRGTTLFGPVIGGAEGHDRELAEGLRTTLERIKDTVERA